MRSQSCGFRNRLITLSICICVFLAFSTTLSATPATFVPGTANLSSVYGTYTPGGWGSTTIAYGPYPGQLSINGVAQSPNTLYFCLTGNQGLIQSGETGTEAPPSVVQGSLMTVTQEEEAAFLASLLLSYEVTDKINVTSNGTTVTLTQQNPSNPVMNFQTFVNDVLGPIQMAIWEVMGTVPGGRAFDTNTITKNMYNLATTVNLQNYSYGSDDVFYTTCGQSFISVPVPEPGTMVLFGAGGLLMALGSARRLLARRRS